jgi:hypothetical protein
MFRTPYRPCPFCRSQLQRQPEKDQLGWEWYFCNQNCGSIACMKPFAHTVDRKAEDVVPDQSGE